MTDLLHSEEEEALRAAVRDLLTDRSTAASVLGLVGSGDSGEPGEPGMSGELEAPGVLGAPGASHDRALWRTLTAGMGLAGLLIPEELDGQGASHREAAVVLEELGRAVAPVPYLTSAVVATEALLECGADDLLRDLASGTAVAALCVGLHTAPTAGFRTVRVGDGALLYGELPGIADAGGADVLLVPAEDGALYAVAVGAAGCAGSDGPAGTDGSAGPDGPSGSDGPARSYGPAGPDGSTRPARSDGPEGTDESTAVTVVPQVSLDRTRPVATVVLAGAAGRRLGEAGPAVRRALRAGAGLLASEQLGLADWALTETVRYLTERKQFNRPVGGFQALKHRLAHLWLETAQLRAAARAAADALATGREPDLAVAVAQAYAAGVAVHATEEALQLHGGIGMTWEHPLHLYLKRAKADSIAYGTAGAHREWVGELVDLAPA
ncbi:acyl-CoA dehydrogenase family protein [Streptomyces sp. NPDC093252]|uniref:acyl-CoA dehydrogenase family protein n=1 Tax=Streptomyces sp. NPDC093252 TaxID=3154980 RepID=UPI003423D877